METSTGGALTLSEWVLFDVLSADGDVFEEALSGVGAALLHWVLGTQGEDSQVLEGQHQFDECQVQLLSKDLTNLVALILQVGSNVSFIHVTYCKSTFPHVKKLLHNRLFS